MKRLLIGLLKDIARYALVGVSLIVALFASAIYLPLLKTSHQDACDFGPVSNDEYRTYLAEVVRRQQVKWGAFTTDINQITREFNNRLSDLLAPEDRVYVRVAKMHAILRGIGASYLNTNGNLDRDPYDPNSVGSVQFNYEVDINRYLSSSFIHARSGYPRLY